MLSSLKIHIILVMIGLDVVRSTDNLSSTITCYKEPVGEPVGTHIFFVPGRHPVPRWGAYSAPQSPSFDIPTALHLREICSVNIASGEMRHNKKKSVKKQKDNKTQTAVQGPRF